MAEETRNASKSAPLGLVATSVMVAIVGFMYTLGLLFATPDLEQDDVVALYGLSCGLKGGLTLAALLVINQFFAGMSSLTGLCC